MSSTTHGATPYYFVPGPSRHPVMAAIGLFFVILGADQTKVHLPSVSSM